MNGAWIPGSAYGDRRVVVSVSEEGVSQGCWSFVFGLCGAGVSI